MSLWAEMVCRCSARCGVSAGTLRKPAWESRTSVLPTARPQAPSPRVRPIRAIQSVGRMSTLRSHEGGVSGAPLPAANARSPRRSKSSALAGQGPGSLRVEELECLLVDLHVLAIGDGRRLGRAHEMAPAPRKACGMELLERRLMVLEGVHLGEVVMHDNRGQPVDE